MFVYGMFVPRRDAMAQAVLAWSILSVVFLGEATGLLAHTCPPLPGARCQVRSSGVAFSRSLAMGFTMMVAAHITSFIGESLRRQEAQTRSLSREYLALAEQKLGFVTMVAHEFRTPVSVIQMVSETLGRYGDRLTPTQRQERQRKIHRAARQLTTLLDDVLALGRSRSSAARFEFAPVDFDALCHEVAEQVHFDPAARGGGAIDVQADAGVIVGDAELLRRILRNLLTNAVKYSPGGTPVGLQTRREDQTVVLTVRDSGMGIPLEDQPRLFHPFVRASNVGGVAGSGLGLAIVREAVTAHGGTIDVESAVGRGTTMIVRLPVQAPVTRAA
jgi:signal transduction histidine kinase